MFRDACPLIKAVQGMSGIKTSEIYDNCSMFVIPITCDCKKKIAGMLKDIKPTITLHIPPVKDNDEDIELYLGELYRLIPALEDLTGNKITEKSLARSINQTGYAQYEMSEFMKFRKHIPDLLHGTQVMAVMNAYSYMQAWDWAEQMHRLNGELAQRLKDKHFVSKANQPRILITGSPITFPNMKIPLLIEEMGGRLSADETCLGERALYDAVAVIDNGFDGMMRALANRYIRPCCCPIFVHNKQRLYRIKQMIKDYQIDGVTNLANTIFRLSALRAIITRKMWNSSESG